MKQTNLIKIEKLIKIERKKIFKYDLHVHSNYSTDGEMTIEQACEKAINLGLDGIAITDHLDFDFPHDEGESFPLIDFKKYGRHIERLRNIYDKTSFKIFKGIEAGIQPHVIKETSDIIKKFDFDYVIASVHIIEGMDPYKGMYYKDKTKKEAYEKYLLKIIEMINNFEDFDNVGHFEYIIRCACYDDKMLRYNEYSDLFDEIFKLLIRKGKGFELNTGSFRDNPGIKAAEFDFCILKRYRELGGEIISLGSDAHNTCYIGYKFPYFKELVKQAGFNYLTFFEKRKPLFEKI